MSTNPIQNGNEKSTSSDDFTTVLIWLLVGVVFLIVIWSGLVRHAGILGALGIVFILAAGTYIVSFAFFLRKSKQSFRIPMSDSTRVFVSTILLVMVSMGLSELGPFKATGIAALCAIGWYSLSYIFFQRKVTESFRIPMDRWIRYLFPFPVAVIVSSVLELRLLEEIGAVWLLYMGTYIVSYLFFSTRVDTLGPDPVEAAVSES
ncbi:MAG: hypothetical protein F4W92_03985 [Gammaproteobacteria bacterium]|nr:hypothetical protein [Gammaproteobacteria bacterium]